MTDDRWKNLERYLGVQPTADKGQTRADIDRARRRKLLGRRWRGVRATRKR